MPRIQIKGKKILIKIQVAVWVQGKGKAATKRFAAISSAKLTETYKIFLPFDLAIQKENNSGGLYKAELQIKLD